MRTIIPDRTISRIRFHTLILRQHRPHFLRQRILGNSFFRATIVCTITGFPCAAFFRAAIACTITGFPCAAFFRAAIVCTITGFSCAAIACTITGFPCAVIFIVFRRVFVPHISATHLHAILIFIRNAHFRGSSPLLCQQGYPALSDQQSRRQHHRYPPVTFVFTLSHPVFPAHYSSTLLATTTILPSSSW